MTHGFDLGGDLGRQLRGPVAPAAIAWVEQQTGRRVVAQQPLEGGTTAAMHRLVLDRGEDLVLQRFVLDWITEEPWVPFEEAMVLKLLVETLVPAPRLIAADADGMVTGAPTVLMTALPGCLVWDPPDLDVWIDALVETLVAISEVPTSESLRSWEPYAPDNAPPPWTKHRWAWQLAIAAYQDRDHWPANERVFVHRDFHPGNILWMDTRVSGVVDWTDSCLGPTEQDVARCRVNLARHHNQEIADRFLDRWLRATGRTEYHPYWDLLDIVSMGGGEPDSGLDDFVASAAARL